MTLSSLPNSPPAPAPTPWPSARRRRAIIELVWLVGVVTFLFWVRQTADAIRRPPPPISPPSPQDFEVIRKRFAEVKNYQATADEVERLLGPPNSFDHREPEIEDYNRQIEAHPDRYPGKRSWAKWADPADKTRWVAVLYVGDVVYYKLPKPRSGGRR